MNAHVLPLKPVSPQNNARDVLGSLLQKRGDEVEDWIKNQYGRTPSLFYSSVDLRRSEHKLVPVDTNLFPAGFNLLNEQSRKRGAEQVKAYIKNQHSGARRVILIPENHTRNTYYLENVFALQSILKLAGLEVMVGGLATTEVETLETASGNQLTLHPLTRKGDLLTIGSFMPDLILINNDLSAGKPELLEQLNQPVFPPISLGWFQRRKTGHFDSYADIAQRFARHFDIDPWLIAAIHTKCGSINFKDMTGLECVALNVERALSRIQSKYNEFGIKDAPYVFIKADSGTYGMGIMTVRSADEVMELNKKDRNKMNVIKEGVTNSEVIIQEGVPTVDEVEGNPAEPMIYLMNGEPIACLFRANNERDRYGNLNSRGMQFTSSEDSKNLSGHDLCPMQGLIARLATLAAARECYEMNWEI